MIRFIIKDEMYNKPVRLYYNNYEEARQKYPNAEITVDTDTEYLKYVTEIKSLAAKRFYDCKGREIWKIPHNNSYILYRQFTDKDEGNYIDGCTYQRWENGKTTNPILWDISTPKEFCKTFLQKKPICDSYQPCISLKELKKRKAKKFYNKNGKCYWVDGNGYFYGADKCDLPNKNEKEEYKRFNGNPEAVYVSYGTEIAFRERGWFDNLEQFLQVFEPLVEENSSYYYEILKVGYKKEAPENRNVIVALPYIDIDTEIKLTKRNTANENSIAHTVAKIWCKQMSPFFGNTYSNMDWVEDIVKKYMENTHINS